MEYILFELPSHMKLNFIGDRMIDQIIILNFSFWQYFQEITVAIDDVVL